jgi:single-strand DNA-binding protein
MSPNMSGETLITIVGGLTEPPELKFTASGAAVASFTVASTTRTFDKTTNEWKDSGTLYMRCSLWRQPAENLAESGLEKGCRVVVTGRLKQRSYETREGEKRTVVELDVEEVGPSLKYATAVVTKATGNSNRGNTAQSTQRPGGGQATRGAQRDDPWASGGASGAGGWGGSPATDEPPF